MAAIETSPKPGKLFGQVSNPPRDGRTVLLECGLTEDPNVAKLVSAVDPILWKQLNIDPKKHTFELVPAKKLGVTIEYWSGYHRGHIDRPVSDKKLVLVASKLSE